MVEPEYLMMVNRISDSLLRVAHAVEAIARSVDPGFVTHDATVKIRAMRQRNTQSDSRQSPVENKYISSSSGQ
jgi:hypothetical protein